MMRAYDPKSMIGTVNVERKGDVTTSTYQDFVL